MNKKFKSVLSFVLTIIFSATSMTAMAEEKHSNRVKLLTAHFAARQVVQVEAGDFHFVPGQDAPIHTHVAPAIGYVAKGEIIYQVEGEKQIILREGDAFYEPAGPRILQFDNASATEEAIFIDFNLEQEGEPFIVFEHAPTEAIDRRTLPTVELDTTLVDQTDIYSTDIEQGTKLEFISNAPTLGIVARGVIELRIKGERKQRIVAGESFAIPQKNTQATVINASPELEAQIITFVLQ